MNAWSNYFAAIAGATATLAGLIFVGVSISLARILATPALPGRASESLVLLITALVLSSMCLVPGLSSFELGVGVLLTGVIVWVIILRIDIQILNKTDISYKKHAWRNILFSQLSTWPYIIAGVILVAHGEAGIYWLVPGITFSFIKAVIDAWVLLVEIHR
jgi:hypothetical protein